jgi:hypothetical protein
MVYKRFIETHKEEIDRTILQKSPNNPKITNRERELWVANDEGLYNWAESEKKLGRQEASKQWIHPEKKWDIKRKIFAHKLKGCKCFN